MRLSIIVPIYNGNRYLEKLVHTIHAFTFSDFECIFIDNNSTDGSLTTLKSLLLDSKFAYTLLSEPKQGAGPARNSGIASAKGEYLAFLDCDDLILPEKFETDMRIFDAHDVDFVFCRAERFYDNGRRVAHPTNGIKKGVNTAPTLGLVWLANYFLLQGTGSLMVRKKVVESLGGFPALATGEDAFLFIKMALLYNGYFYDTINFHYFRHSTSSISRSNREEDGSLKRYFILRQQLFRDREVANNFRAMHILREQLQTDILKLHRLGNSMDGLRNENLEGLKLSFLLFNPLSLFINRRIPHIKYNPFFQVDRRFFKKQRDKMMGNAKEGTS